MIICNNCTGGFLYRDFYKREYDNPFIWTFMDGENFLKLISNFDTINFRKFNLSFDGKNYVGVIDDTVKILYFHHHKSDTIFEIKGIDCYSSDIENYIMRKYNSRVNRMLDSNEDPIFIIGTPYEKTEYGKIWDWERYYPKIDELKSKYRIVIFSNKFIAKQKEHYPIDLNFTDNKDLAKYIFETGII